VRTLFSVGCLGYRSSNFIVGLTNDHPVLHAPVLWNYTLCGQYPGTVPDGATVTVQCTNAFNSGLTFRYVIVQFPLINESINFCEIEVFAVGKLRCISVTIRKRTSLNVMRIAVIITSKVAASFFYKLTIVLSATLATD